MDRPSPDPSLETKSICLSLAVAGTVLLASLALIACAVRLAFPDAAPLPLGICFTATLLTAAWGAFDPGSLAGSAAARNASRLPIGIAVVPLAAAILVTRSVTFFPMGEFSTFLLWFTCLAEEAITLGLFVPAHWGTELLTWIEAPYRVPAAGLAEENPPTVATCENESPQAEAAVADETELEAVAEESSQLPLDVTQQLTRVSLPQEEQVHGLVRSNFAAGQRHAYLHIGFCPPLASLPEVQIYQLEGPEAQVKVGQRLSSGVRFDLKLRDAPADMQTAVFEFFAKAPAATTDEEFRAAG